jgi:outer membrane protein TolC
VEEARLQKTKSKESVRQYRLNFAHRWTQSDQSLNLLKATRALTEENLALAKLEAKRATIEFESGQFSFAQVLEGQEKVSQEEIRAAQALFNLRRQKLNRHFMSGDFSHRFFGPQLTPKNHMPVE